SPDHHQGHFLVEASRFYSQLTKWNERFEGTEPYRVPNLVYVPFPFDAEQRPWQSTFIIDVSATFAQKLEAIRCYRSQFDEARFAKVAHFVSGYNTHMGARCGFEYGELFALPHPVGASDLVSLATGGKDSPAAVQLPGQGHLPMG